LFELMKLPNYLAAYKAMVGGVTVPDWVNGFATTLDGPPMSSVDLLAGGKIYTLGFTCKPNACGDNQLYVLFAPDATQAWGLLIQSGLQSWLGNPDPTIQQAILSRLE
jgi:hypothetical protein